MNRITSLYPQYKPSTERRQNSIPVAIDRRSGSDRRTQDRVKLDSKLTRDIYEVKGQVAKFENMSPRLFNKVITTQPTFASKNNLVQDQFYKSIKPDISEILKQEAKLQAKEDTAFKMGVISAALAGVVAASFMGTAGAVIAVGSLVYIGSKLFKNAVANEIKDNNKEN